MAIRTGERSFDETIAEIDELAEPPRGRPSSEVRSRLSPTGPPSTGSWSPPTAAPGAGRQDRCVAAHARVWRNPVDAPVSDTGGETHGGSTPSIRIHPQTKGTRLALSPGSAPNDRRAGLGASSATPWPSGEARVCKARHGGSSPPGVSAEPNDNEKGGTNDEHDQDVRRGRRAQPRAARALHDGRRRRLRRAVRRPSPWLQPADRRRDRLRGLRVAVRRRLRHRLRQQGCLRPSSRGPTSTRSAASSRSCARSRAGSRSAWACRPPSASITRCSTGSAAPTSLRSASCAAAPSRSSARSAPGNHYVEPDGGRGRPHLGRGALRLARLRPQDRLGLPRARAGTRRSTRGRREGEMDSPPVLFEVGSELGESYIAAMELAGEYAYAGRDVVVAKVLEILGAEAMPRGAQPPQLRVAGGAPRSHLLGRAQGLHARATRVRRGSSAARWATTRSSSRASSRTRRGVAVLDGARRRPRDEPYAGGGQGPPT